LQQRSYIQRFTFLFDFGYLLRYFWMHSHITRIYATYLKKNFDTSWFCFRSTNLRLQQIKLCLRFDLPSPTFFGIFRHIFIVVEFMIHTFRRIYNDTFWFNFGSAKLRARERMLACTFWFDFGHLLRCFTMFIIRLTYLLYSANWELSVVLWAEYWYLLLSFWIDDAEIAAENAAFTFWITYNNTFIAKHSSHIFC